LNEFALARVIHVLAVVLWIGGVAMITTVVIPIIRKFRSGVESVELFEAIGKKFSLQAKCDHAYFELIDHRRSGGGQSRLVSDLILEGAILD